MWRWLGLNVGIYTIKYINLSNLEVHAWQVLSNWRKMHTPQSFFDVEEVHVVSSLVCEDVCQEQNPFTLASAMCNPEDRAPQSVWAKCRTVGGTARMKSSETALNEHNLVIETVPNKKVVTKVVFFLLWKRKLFACHLNRLQMLSQYSSFTYIILWVMMWLIFDVRTTFPNLIKFEHLFWFGAQDPEFFKDFSEYFDLAPLPSSGLYGQMCYVTWCNMLVNRIPNHKTFDGRHRSLISPWT